MISKLFEGPHMRDFYKRQVMVLLLLLSYLARIFRWCSDAMVLCTCDISAIQRPKWGGFFTPDTVLTDTVLTVLIQFFWLYLGFFLFSCGGFKILCYRDNATICFLITRLLGSVDHLQASVNVLFSPDTVKMDINFKFCTKIQGK